MEDQHAFLLTVTAVVIGAVVYEVLSGLVGSKSSSPF